MSATIEDQGSIIGQLWKSKTQPGRVLRITSTYGEADTERVRVVAILAASIMHPEAVNVEESDLYLESLLGGYKQVG